MPVHDGFGTSNGVQKRPDVSAHPLAHLNALLNAAAAILLVVGYRQIRQRRVAAHRRTMLTAFGVSVAFLVSYVAYHMGVLGATTTRFAGQGPLRTVYLTILVSHVILAATVPLLASITIFLGLRIPGTAKGGSGGRATEPAAGRHRRLARLTLPIWLYVSVTGVLIYLMLYHLFPGG